MAQRILAVVLCLGLVAGNAAVCAGWAPTAEARMACCTDGGTCPMHDGQKGGSRASQSGRMLTQAEADSCCASSERDSSSPSTPSFAATISVAVLGTGVVLAPTLPSLAVHDYWRIEAPIPSPPVPRHVLLSVFLV